MKYTKIPADTFENIQLNAGILVDSFEPSTGEVGNILGATTGGNNFSATNEFSDFGEDIDNCPKNMKELKHLDSVEAKLTGTFVTVSANRAKDLVGAADIDPDDATHVIPRRDLIDSDFKELWFVGDYSDINNGDNAGFIAIHMMNTLSTGGFQIQSTDKKKGNFAFEYMAHFSMANQNVVPYDLYISKGQEQQTKYSITQNLTHVTSSNDATEAVANSEYTTTLAANEDYTMDTVTVTMGGLDITETAYTEATGVVNIANVTGNVVITATATAGA